MTQVYIWWQKIIVIVYKLELVDRIRRLASIGWAERVAAIIRLATVGNGAGVVKEIVVLIVSRLVCVARTAILSSVAWVGSPGRLSRITRILGISRLGSAGSVARWQPIILIVYKLELVDRIRRLASIGWAERVATIIRLATEGNGAGVVKEIVVLIVSRLECVARTAILSGVAWVGCPGRLSRITRILGISWLAGTGSVASVHMVTNNESKSIPARINW